MPHLTIVKMPELASAESALLTARTRWASFAGAKIARIQDITFVREGADSQWVDIATVKLRQP